MRRREFITILGGAAATWTLAARAQQARKLPTIGFLGSSTPTAQSRWIAAFVQRLHELGWIEGRTIAIEYRYAEGSTERYTEIAAEFVRLKLDLLREMLTGLRRLAIMGNLSNPVTVLDIGEVKAAARRLGVDIISLDVRRAEDIAPAFNAINGRAEALYVSNDPLIFTNINRINTLAVGARLPTIHNS